MWTKIARMSASLSNQSSTRSHDFWHPRCLFGALDKEAPSYLRYQSTQHTNCRARILSASDKIYFKRSFFSGFAHRDIFWAGNDLSCCDAVVSEPSSDHRTVSYHQAFGLIHLINPSMLGSSTHWEAQGYKVYGHTTDLTLDEFTKNETFFLNIRFSLQWVLLRMQRDCLQPGSSFSICGVHCLKTSGSNGTDAT